MPNKRLTRLLFAQGGLCFFCKKPLPAVDASVEHLDPRCNGGSNRDENCVACCKSLNALLGSRSLKEKIEVFLNQKGQFECPNGVQNKVIKKGPPSPKAAKVPEYYAKVVANLRQRGDKKPRTVAKLKNTIASLFPDKLAPNQVDGLVQQLQSRQVIFVAGSKVTYA
ncbi:MAG TPA: HNH endonuclease signature motif containing protein [Pyrinomonadaceae bacterium]|nr:HNH endonuclease signature motif containing protein [Pyrinomonadaceae bacterium]